MPRQRQQMDSATLIARDALEAAQQGSSFKPALARTQFDSAPQFNDGVTTARRREFIDPGHEHGASIKCPSIYEALRKKGYSKEKAARISNSRC